VSLILRTSTDRFGNSIGEDTCEWWAGCEVEVQEVMSRSLTGFPLLSTSGHLSVFRKDGEKDVPRNWVAADHRRLKNLRRRQHIDPEKEFVAIQAYRLDEGPISAAVTCFLFEDSFAALERTIEWHRSEPLRISTYLSVRGFSYPLTPEEDVPSVEEWCAGAVYFQQARCAFTIGPGSAK